MKFNALLVGPEDTPYAYGMFEFLLVFPNGLSESISIADIDYPSKAPQYDCFWGYY